MSILYDSKCDCKGPSTLFFSFYDSSKCQRLTRSICTRLNYTTSQRHYIRLCCIYIQPYSLNYTTTQTFPYSCVLCINRLYGSAEQSCKLVLIGRIVYASLNLPAKLPENVEHKKLRKKFFQFTSATFGAI